MILAAGLLLAVLVARAATNVSSTSRWAWNEGAGWIDHFITDTVNVTSNKIEGYATSSVGYIAFDCATSPNGNVCGAPATWSVTNDGSGNLSGWAWNDGIGWISFYCDDISPGCIPFVYRVTVDTDGDFHGYAWNDAVGWISFNCQEPGLCGGVSDYRVNTAWRFTAASGTLISSIFDTQETDGAVPNTIMWQGSLPGGSVKFQLASSDNSGGPSWDYKGPLGTENDFYEPLSPNLQVKITAANHLNHRYFRYKVFIETDVGQTVSPRVDDIIIGWSP